MKQNRIESEQVAAAIWAAQLVAACRREHCHYLQDHRVATQARHRRLKVRILITETKSDTEYMQYAQYNKYALK